MLIGAAINRHIPQDAKFEEIAKTIDTRCNGLTLQQKASIMAIIEDIRKRPNKATLYNGHSSGKRNKTSCIRKKKKKVNSLFCDGVIPG